MASEKIKGIVLNLVRHSDRHNIVNLFTRSHGRLSFLVAAGKNKNAAKNNSALMPLSVIATDVTFKGNRELHTLRNFERVELWKDIYFNPVKSSLGLFITEFLNIFLRETPPDAHLWDFIVESLRELDNAKSGVANFHIAFLIEFLKYAGISPDIGNYYSMLTKPQYFDMRDGSFSNSVPLHRDVIMGPEAAMLRLILRMNIKNCRYYKFNADNRRYILRKILRYYSIHFPGFSSLKSLDVLEQVFG